MNLEPTNSNWFYWIEGALICVVIAWLLLAFLLVIVMHWRDSRRWRRYVRLFRAHKDPEARALEIVRLAEASDIELTDSRMPRGFRAAWRRGLIQDRDQ